MLFRSRLDAAKRKKSVALPISWSSSCCLSDIPVADLQAIMGQVNTQGKKLYITQEVVFGGGVSPNEYTQTGERGT